VIPLVTDVRIENFNNFRFDFLVYGLPEAVIIAPDPSATALTPPVIAILIGELELSIKHSLLYR